MKQPKWKLAPRNPRSGVDFESSSGESRSGDSSGKAIVGENRGLGAIKTGLAVAGALLGATAMLNAFIASKTPGGRLALGGDFNRFPVRGGDVAYVVAGAGTPVLLLHGLGAGNSMAEWNANFAALSERHTVYALDLLGWGLSDRPAQEYGATDAVEQIVSFAQNVIGESCALITSGDSCAYAVEAAARQPELFSRLVLVCPPTVTKNLDLPLHGASIKRLLGLPIVGQSVYNVLTSRRAIRSFAGRHLYFDKQRVDDALVTQSHRGAHQPGARHALASWLSGQSRHDARDAWSRLKQPALLIWGRNALIDGLDTAPEWLALKPDARLEVVENAMLLPHAEHAPQWNELVLGWLAA